MSLPMMLYLPLAAIGVALVVLALHTARRHAIPARRRGPNRIAVTIALALAASAVLIVAIDSPWTAWSAVLILLVVLAPIAIPVGAVLLTYVKAWVSGQPVRWL